MANIQLCHLLSKIAGKFSLPSSLTKKHLIAQFTFSVHTITIKVELTFSVAGSFLVFSKNTE